MQPLIALLRLMRPANIVTAVSDILAGVAVARFATGAWNGVSVSSTLLLVLSTIGLYGGGVVMNDVFDAELDKVERPERPIPSGAVSKEAASFLGVALLVMGVVAAAFSHPANVFSLSAVLAFVIAVAALVYDKWGKHQFYLGPVNMGLCRGLNLLLGMSLFPAAVAHYWWLGLVPVTYIAAITMISRGEVHGSGRRTLLGAVAMYAAVVMVILCIALANHALNAIAFLLLFCFMIFFPLQKAIRRPKGPLIGKAVKAGVIALIVMNAAWAAAFGSFYFALCILTLLPLSLLLAKAFAVT